MWIETYRESVLEVRKKGKKEGKKCECFLREATFFVRFNK